MMKDKTASRIRSIVAHVVLIILSFMCLFFFYVLIVNASHSHADFPKSSMPGLLKKVIMLSGSETALHRLRWLQCLKCRRV